MGQKRLWLIGGTEESRWLAEKLISHRASHPGHVSAGLYLPPLVSVVTDTARQLYPDTEWLFVWVGRLTPDTGTQFIQDYHITAILDASHPFATEISQLAIALAGQHNLPYLRYERTSPQTAIPEAWYDAANRPGNVRLSHIDELLANNYLLRERTLLTVGYRMLPDFQAWHSKAVLFARILPSPEALAAALDAGFTPARLIALRPPISEPLEQALWQHWQVTQVVAKASGPAGGEDRKCRVAAALGVRLIRLDRPVVHYPAKTDSLERAAEFAVRYCH